MLRSTVIQELRHSPPTALHPLGQGALQSVPYCWPLLRDRQIGLTEMTEIAVSNCGVPVRLHL